MDTVVVIDTLFIKHPMADFWGGLGFGIGMLCFSLAMAVIARLWNGKVR